MDLHQTLKSFVRERLSAAAEEICGTVGRIITEYEDEAFRLKQEIDHKHKLLDLILKPVIKLHRAGPVCKEVFPERQERNSSLVQEEPELPQIKEGQEEILLRPEERLALLAVESDEDNGENTEIEPVASTSTEHMKTQADVKDRGTSQPTGDDQLLSSYCSESDTEDVDGEREETRQDQLALNILKSHKIQGQICFLNITVSQGLTSSNITSYTGKKAISCPDCCKSFGQTSDLKMHIKTHAWEKPFRCSVCWKGFTQRCNLAMHMRSHTGEKPFSCTVCGKSCSQNSDLKTHMRIHTGEIPFNCTVCGQGFRERGNMKKHMRTHTSEKPFRCTVCDKAFSQNANLKKHMLIHTGDKAFSCTFCGKSFSQNANLKTHLKNKH